MRKAGFLVIGILLIALVFTNLFAFTEEIQSQYGLNPYDNSSDIGNVSDTFAVSTVEEEGRTLHEEGEEILNNEELGNPLNPLNWYSYTDWIFKSFLTTFKTIGRSGATAAAMIEVGSEKAGVPQAGAIIAVIISITFILMIIGYLTNRGY